MILYFFPKAQGIPKGYKWRFRQGSTSAKNVRGPGPSKGLLITPKPACILSYNPSVQRWDKISDELYLGVHTNYQTKDFIRSETFPGHWVTLADGKQWLIPVANPLTGRCGFPSHDVFLEGEWNRKISDLYINLSNRAADIAARLQEEVLGKGSDSKLDIDDNELRQLIGEVIMCNYDVTLYELSVMRVFSTDIYWDAVRAFADWDEIQNILKQLVEEAKAESPL